MDLHESLLKIYDKRSFCFSEHMDRCEIEEHDKCASFHHLYIQNAGAQLRKFDTNYVKDFKNSTENISSVLKDSNCDGVVFIKGKDEKLHFVFTELKSKQTADNLKKAFKQVIFTFIKYHQLLSICSDYDISNITIDFVLSCHAADNNEYAETYLDVQSEQILIADAPTKQFVADMLPVLMNNKSYSFKLKDVDILNSYPFNQYIIEKSIKMHLATSITSTDDNATITFNY